MSSVVSQYWMLRTTTESLDRNAQVLVDHSGACWLSSGIGGGRAPLTFCWISGQPFKPAVVYLTGAGGGVVDVVLGLNVCVWIGWTPQPPTSTIAAAVRPMTGRFQALWGFVVMAPSRNGCGLSR